MEFRILGPLEVTGERGPVALDGIKPRAVLAVLLLHRNQPVSAERLAAALWGEEAPSSATRTVQVYVSRLRKALGDPGVVATTPAGYRLQVSPDELDAARFERDVEAGRRALAAGSPAQAANLLRDALSLWRGPPLAELEFEPFAQTAIAGLEEQRLAAIETRAEADLAAGRHAALVSELRQLLAEHPTRERLAAHLMLALYRCGRQTEALEVYREKRAVLVEQAGIEPGPELRRLHEAVLAQERSLDLPAAPSDLPRALALDAAPPLIGREAELARLREHWETASAGAGGFVTVIGGAGMGKTRLAAEAARAAHDAGADVRYLTGRDPAGAVLGALGELGAAGRPTLCVVDDADRAGDAVRAALEPPRGVPVLLMITASHALGGVRAGDAIELTPLDAAAVAEIAGPAVPHEWLLAASGGVPRRVHELVRGWAREQAERRVDLGVERTAAGRAELRSTQAALADDLRELQAAWERPLPAPADDRPVRCPFKGLASFDVPDAPYFFGRERLVAELVARLVGATLLGVVGPSGSGKSSVVRAGLLPALAAGVLPGCGEWAQGVMRPGEHPLRELARATAGAGTGPMVLVVDQFEETFTACRDERERAAFIAELVASDRPGRVVVLAIRADHYGRCAAYPRLPGPLAANHVLVGAMRRDELRRAVERPALRAGLRVEPELTDALLEDVEHEPGALPMLSTALLELWQHRDGRSLRLTAYEAAGGVRGAVARHAERAFGLLDEGEQTVARSVLLRLAGEGADGGVERRRVPLDELAAGEEAAAVVELLADERVLTISSGAVEVAHEALLREWPRLRGWLEEDAEGRRVHRRLAEAAREWDAGGRDAADLYRGARLAGALEWRARHAPELNPTERDFLDAGRAAEHAARARRRRGLSVGVAVLVAIAGISTALAIRGVQHARFERRAADSRTLATRALAQLHGNVALAGLLGLEALRRSPTVEARNAVLSVLPALSDYHRLGLPLETGSEATFAISPDGRTLVTATDVGTITFWDLVTRRRLGPPLADAGGLTNDLAFSPDGRLLASIGADGTTVRLWDVASRRPLATLPQHVALVTSVAFSSDGRTLAAGGGRSGTSSGHANATVRLWDVATRRQLGAPLRTGDPYVADVQFSPDGRLLAAAGDDGLRFLDVASGRPLGPPLGGLGAYFTAVAFSPDGRTLAVADDGGTVTLWDVQGHTSLGKLVGHTEEVNAVAFSPDGRTLASGGNDATVRLWDAATHRRREVLVSDTDRAASAEDTSRVAGVLAVAFTPQGILLSSDEQGAVRLWRPRAGRPLSRPLQGHSGWIRGVAFAKGGAMVSAGLDRTLRRWDPRTGRPLGRPLPLAHDAFAVATAPDGRTAAVAGADGMLQEWDLRRGRPVGRPLPGQTEAVKAVAFSPDGRTLASGGDDGTVHLWDAAHGRALGRPLDSHTLAVNGIAFAPDGKTVAAAAQDGSVREWDVSSHRARGRPLQGPSGFVGAVAFSPDGKTLAAAGADKSIWLWDPDTGRPLGPPLTGHTDVVTALSFSADGRTLASTSADHTVRLWDVHSGRALGLPLAGHTGWVSAVAFGPHDAQLASAGEDTTVRLWDPILWSADAAALTRRLCAGIQRSLTRTEWARFIPDRPYHRTCPSH